MPLEVIGQSTQTFTFAEYLEVRKLLARQAGIALCEMQGYGGTTPWEQIANPDDPIVFLLKRPDHGCLMPPTEAFFCGHRIQALLEGVAPAHPLKARIHFLAEDMALTGALSENVFFLKAL